MYFRNLALFKKKDSSKEDTQERRNNKYLCFQWSLINKKNKKNLKQSQQDERNHIASQNLLAQCIETTLSLQPASRYKRSISMIQTPNSPQTEGRQRKGSLPVYFSQLETIPEILDSPLAIHHIMKQ